jgi:hypothetical protein
MKNSKHLYMYIFIEEIYESARRDLEVVTSRNESSINRVWYQSLRVIGALVFYSRP